MAEVRRINVVRTSLATGVALAVLLVLCWIGAFVPFASPTHSYVALFTAAELHSIEALIEGTLWALLFGLVAGAVLAMAYNLFSRFERY